MKIKNLKMKIINQLWSYKNNLMKRFKIIINSNKMDNSSNNKNKRFSKIKSKKMQAKIKIKKRMITNKSNNNKVIKINY